MNIKRKILYLCFFIAFAPLCFAKGLFGPEWTFTVKNPDNAYDIQEFLRKKMPLLHQEILSACSECKEGDNYDIIFREYTFNLVIDLKVVEINATGMTAEVFDELKNDIQKIIFDSAAKIGLTPHERIGGGHIHLGVATHFQNDPLKIRNFIVDIFNHPEMFLGGLGDSTFNAPPLSILSEEQIDIFEKILDEFDSGKIDINLFVQMIREQVYIKSFYDIGQIRDEGVQRFYQMYPSKFQLLCLDNFPETLEIRGLPPQKTAAIYGKLINLFNARIVNFTNKQNKPIPFVRKHFTNEGGLNFYRPNEYLTEEDIFKVIKSYVEGAKLKVENYLDTFTGKMNKYLDKTFKSCPDAFYDLILSGRLST